MVFGRLATTYWNEIRRTYFVGLSLHLNYYFVVVFLKASDEASSLGYDDIMTEITKLRQERDVLIRSVNELERKKTNLDISVESVEKNRLASERELDLLSRKRSELESGIFALKTEKFELETRVNELSAMSVENATSAQRKEIDMLRSELEITRESCEDIRSMYNSVQYEGKNKVIKSILEYIYTAKNQDAFSKGLIQIVDDKSVVSCQQTCCKLIVETCYPQACYKLFQQVVTSLQMTSCNKPNFNRLVAT